MGMEETKSNEGAPHATGRLAEIRVVELRDVAISIPSWIPVALLLFAVVIGLVFWRRRRRNNP